MLKMIFAAGLILAIATASAIAGRGAPHDWPTYGYCKNGKRVKDVANCGKNRRKKNGPSRTSASPITQPAGPGRRTLEDRLWWPFPSDPCLLLTGPVCLQPTQQKTRILRPQIAFSAPPALDLAPSRR